MLRLPASINRRGKALIFRPSPAGRKRGPRVLLVFGNTSAALGLSPPAVDGVDQVCTSSLHGFPGPRTSLRPTRSPTLRNLLPVGRTSPHGYLKPKFSNTRAGPAAYVRDPHASVTGHGCSRVTSRGRCTSSWALSGPEGTWDDCIKEIAAKRFNTDSGQSIPPTHQLELIHRSARSGEDPFHGEILYANRPVCVRPGALLRERSTPKSEQAERTREGRTDAPGPPRFGYSS